MERAMGETRRIAGAIDGWFRESARVLPWRDAVGGRRDAYRVLVSELMLQQTQVSRVVEKFEAFIARFPDVGTLARARESSVLAMWSGLGYYRRARMLHAAAKEIVARFGGEVPREVEVLVSLPGVGRYTAGAVASLAFGVPAAAVDGNVARVLLRVEGAAVTASEGRAQAEALASELVSAADDAAALNEGLIELGATVCRPAGPDCGRCPIARWCRARELGLVERIPVVAARGERRRLWCASVVVEDERGRVLVERRPAGGLWGGLWQAPTVERVDRGARAKEIGAAVGVERVSRIGSFERVLTHRLVRFDVYRGEGVVAGRYKTWAQIERLGMSSAQRAVFELGRGRCASAS